MAVIALEEVGHSRFPEEFNQEVDQAPGLSVLTTPSKSFKITEIDSPEELQKIQIVMKEWLEVVSRRLAHSERDKSTHLENFERDFQQFKNFRTVKGFIDIHARSKYKKIQEDTPDESNVITVLEDQNGVIQAVSASTIEGHRVYVNALLTAPWNLAMHGPNDPDHGCLQAKGAGTRLMAHNYQLAQRKGKFCLSLTPLEAAVGFYQKLGMESRGELYVLPVRDELPFTLRKYV